MTSAERAPLRHSSIIAREYGIPAVMATQAATRAIKSGQLVTVNGGAGTVTIEWALLGVCFVDYQQ